MKWFWNEMDVWQAYVRHIVLMCDSLSHWNFQISFYYNEIGNFVYSRDKSQFIWCESDTEKKEHSPLMKHNTISGLILFEIQRNIQNNQPDACILFGKWMIYKIHTFVQIHFVLHILSTEAKRKLKWKKRKKKNNNKHFTLTLIQAING